MEQISQIPQIILQSAIKSYRYFLKPLLGYRCRFFPSCSEYAHTAIARFGALKGSYLTLLRLLRCQPFCKGGYDPVPPLPPLNIHKK